MRHKNAKSLVKLARVLSRGHFVTAKQIIVETGCSKAIAYSRLRTLRDLGCIFQTCRVREGAAGPEAKAYAIVPNRALKNLLTDKRAAS